jgi:hypothetical protein
MKSFLGSTRLSFPQADDIEGAEFIYPTAPSPTSGGGTVPEGANSCAVVPPRSGSAATVLAFTIPLLLFLRCSAGRRFARKAIDEPGKLL